MLKLDTWLLGGLFFYYREKFRVVATYYTKRHDMLVDIGRKKHLCFFLPCFYYIRLLIIPERLVNSVDDVRMYQTLQSVAGVLALRYGLNLGL